MNAQSPTPTTLRSLAQEALAEAAGLTEDAITKLDDRLKRDQKLRRSFVA